MTRPKNQPKAPEVPSASDPDLMKRLAAGETSALGELYDRYQEPVRRFVALATSDAEDVDDLVQGTFLAAGKSAARYDGRASCRPWLFGIAAQLVRRRRQSFRRWLAVLASFSATRTKLVDPRPALHAGRDVERALGGLSEIKRVTYLMVEVEGLTCGEVAEALKVPIGTVWTRCHAARRELRRALEESDES